MSRDVAQPRWIRAFILFGAGFFILALVLSAVFDPRIRVLHALQALIYVAVIVLTRRNSAWGFGAGFVIAVVWNYVNVFLTTFIARGLEQVAALLRGGHMDRPELLIAVVAGLGHVMLIVACLVGFLRTRPRARGWAEFAAGGVLAVAYFAAIIATTAPPYIVDLMKRAAGQ